jgi:hypothetical protein
LIFKPESDIPDNQGGLSRVLLNALKTPAEKRMPSSVQRGFLGKT